MGSDVEKHALIELGSQSKQETKSGKPQRDCFCKLLNILTALCALLCLVRLIPVISLAVHSFALCRSLYYYLHCVRYPAARKDVTGLLQQALRVYGMSFSVLIMLTETEWEYFLSNVRILDSWLGRGFFQMFEAVLTLELSRLTAQGKTDFHKSLQLYRIVAGVSLLVCSGLYILGGIFCWGRSKAKAKYQREAEKQRVLEDLEALDQKRQELKGLLAVYSNH